MTDNGNPAWGEVMDSPEWEFCEMLASLECRCGQ